MELQGTRGTAIVSESTKDFFDETHVPAAVRNGSMVWVTGQTGVMADGTLPSSPEAQMRQAFVLVADCLAASGAGWSDVVELTTYLVGLREHGELMLAVASEFLDPPFPAWTAVGVAELWEAGAMLELRCTAVVAPDRLPTPC